MAENHVGIMTHCCTTSEEGALVYRKFEAGAKFVAQADMKQLHLLPNENLIRATHFAESPAEEAITWGPHPKHILISPALTHSRNVYFRNVNNFHTRQRSRVLLTAINVHDSEYSANNTSNKPPPLW